MAWGTPPGEDQKPPEDVTEARIREIVRDELAVLAAKKMADDA